MRDPNWTGVDGETAIAVSRGEPRRSDVEMQQAVFDQIQRYLAGLAAEVAAGDFVVSMTSQLIAQDHIEPDGAQGVWLTREHLLKYVEVARTKLTERATVEPDPKSGW